MLDTFSRNLSNKIDLAFLKFCLNVSHWAFMCSIRKLNLLTEVKFVSLVCLLYLFTKFVWKKIPLSLENWSQSILFSEAWNLTACMKNTVLSLPIRQRNLNKSLNANVNLDMLWIPFIKISKSKRKIIHFGNAVVMEKRK